MGKTVLAHGCFDILHVGHIRHLEEARHLGDKLVVSLTSDRYVNKGADRPHFNAEQRSEALRALKCVDEVIVNDAPDASGIISRLKPSVYVKGPDYAGLADDGRLKLELAALSAIGGKVHFTTSPKNSSTALLNATKCPPEVMAYIARCKAGGFRGRILQAFEHADKKRVAFVGETIEDEYCFVEGLGRASKELMLATVRTGYETFMGGVMASAKHGEWKPAIATADDHVITKTRYVDRDFNRKLFDVYSARKIEMSFEERKDFRKLLSDTVFGADVVVVNDFGHGLLTSVERSILYSARFLAVNAQTNAGNYGYNFVTKYKAANYVCIDDPEARLATGMQDEHVDAVMNNLRTRMSCGKFMVTHGRYGCKVLEDGAVKHAPAFSTNGIDTIGAGDAVLAVTAPLVASGLGLEEAAFVGNVVGSIKISIVGHRRHVTRPEIIAKIEELLS